MIDTIHFKLKNAGRYPHLLFKFRNYDQGTKQVTIRPEKAAPLHQRFVHYMDDGKTLDTYSHRFDVSYAYSINYKIDKNRDSIEFNVSIPKYYYKTNVRMYVKHKSDRDFDYARGGTIKKNLDDSFELLHRFIEHFNLKYLNADLNDVVLCRVDLCFNQIFRDKVEKAQYLHYIKGKSKRYSRAGASNAVYKSGIYYVTKYCTYKIYDKGLEFEKNDLKKLRLGMEEAEIKSTKKLADRILRYEVEFKQAFFKRYIRDELEKERKSRYCAFIIKRFGKEIFLEEYAAKFNSRDLCFSPGSPNFYNSRLHRVAVQNFEKFMNEYKVSCIPMGDLDQKIITYNNNRRIYKIEKGKKINDKTMKRFVRDLSEYGKDRMINMEIYSRSSYYRCVARLKELGWATPEIISPMSFVDNWNMQNYHDIYFFG